VAVSPRAASVSTERVLILTTSFPRFPGDVGGHFVESQARRLARQGCAVEVVAPGLAPHDERRGPLLVRWVGGTRAFGAPGVASRLRSAPLLASVDLLRAFIEHRRVLDDSLARRAPDRLIAHWLVPTVWPWLASAPRTLRLDAYAHGGDVRSLLALPRPARYALVATLLERTSRIHFAAASLRSALIDSLDATVGATLAARSLVTLPDLEGSARARMACGRRPAMRGALGGGAEHDFIAVSLGRLVPGKRIDLALEAMRTQRGAELVVIGDGPERARLERRARELNVPARFLGSLGRDEALEHLARADVLLHPSEEEGAPTAVREARALGVPVVGCDAGDLAAWATEDHGIHCVERSAHALASALDAVRAARLTEP